MANEKRYYWLKFREDFFSSRRIKKLRKMAGGDTYLIIYLKMQLKALKTNGVLEYTGIEQEFADELALDIDESPDDVRVVLAFLMNYGLCECSDNIHYFLPFVVENTGSETAGTQRWRDWKNRKDALKESTLLDDNQRNLLESNTSPTSSQQNANVEKEIEIELEIEKDNNRAAKPPRLIPPNIQDVRAYCKERGNNVDPDNFWDFYQAKNWMVGKNKMKDWKAAVRTWERNRKGENKGRYDNLMNLAEEFADE